MTARLRRYVEHWVALWDTREPPTVLAALRIAIAAIVLVDIAEIERLGLAEALYTPSRDGGLAIHSTPLFEALPFLGSSPHLTLGIAAVAMALFGAGIVPAVTGTAWVLVSAAFAALLPSADRGIDILLRNVVLVLAFSPAGRMWSVPGRIRTGRWRGDDRPAPGWARRLLALQLIVVYTTAGFAKVGLAWTPFGEWQALWYVLHDPAYARAAYAWLPAAHPVTQAMTASTWLWEWSTPWLVVARYAQGAPGRLGRVGELVRRHDPRKAWAFFGALFHVGILVLMNLGIFAPAMVALYPALWAPENHPLRPLRAPSSRSQG
jgi:hypothetical protein